MNTPFGHGRVGPSGSPEAELPAWLRGFDAGPMPIAARLRISADLRKFEGRSSGSMLSLARGLGQLAASLALLALAAVVIVGLIGERIGGAVGAPGSVLPGPATNVPGNEQSFGALDPIQVWLLLVMSALVGALVYLRPLRRAAESLVGTADPVLVKLLPLRRKLREIDIRTRALAIVPVGLVAWYALSYRIATPLDVFLLVTGFLPATFAFAAAYRYQLRDRGSRSMFAGGLALLAQVTLSVTWQATNTLVLSEQLAGSPVSDAVRIAQSALLVVGSVALAAGVVCISGVKRRPPLALSAAVVGTTFLLAALNVVQLVSSPSMMFPAYRVPWLLVASTSSWINLLTWMVILWAGTLAALRQRATAGWRFVSVAGATIAITYVVAAASFWLPQLGIGWAPDLTVVLIAESLAMGAMLFALFAGLWPVGSETALQPEFEASADVAMPAIGVSPRISADGRKRAERPPRFLPRLPQVISAAATLLVLLAGSGLLLLIATTTEAGPGGTGAPIGPIPGMDLPYTSPGLSPQLANPLWLALVLCASVLAGAASSWRPIRSTVGRLVLGTDGTVPSPAARLPRRLRDVPRPALLLATLPIVEVAWSRSVYGPTVLAYSISVALPATLACAIALRYPIGDRSARWLLVGGIALAVAKLPELGLGTAAQLGWFDTSGWGPAMSQATLFLEYALPTAGWGALAIGLAARSGVAHLPRWFVVAAAVGAVLYIEVNAAISFGAAISPTSEDLARLVYQQATSCLISFAWLSILWTGISCFGRSHGSRAWQLVLVAGAVQCTLLLVIALMTAGWLPASLDTQVLVDLSWLSLGALLVALLVGLNPVPAEPAESREAVR